MKLSQKSVTYVLGLMCNLSKRSYKLPINFSTRPMLIYCKHNYYDVNNAKMENYRKLQNRYKDDSSKSAF